MKACTRCGHLKGPDEFGPDKKRPDGLKIWCRSCCRDYAREFAKTPEQQAKRRAHYEANKGKYLHQAKKRWRTSREKYEPARQRWAAEHRDEMLRHQQMRGAAYREFIDGLKAGKPCLDCTLSFPPYVMEFDHVRGDKRFDIGKMAHHRRERVLEEIAKCELVCCACHRIRSHARREPPKTPRLLAFHAWIDSLKNHPCGDCGRTLPPVAMDFDHTEEDKVAGISDMWSWRKERVLLELAKCHLVCANCHRIRSVHRLRARAPGLQAST